MGKVFGILLFVALIWLGLNGFAGFESGPSEDGSASSRMQNVRDDVTQAHRDAQERRERMLPN